jgi:large subunit ribosomal protein L4
MTTLTVKNQQGADAGLLELSDLVFAADKKAIVVREVYNAYRTNQRQGTHATKNRPLVSGGGKKPWKQKGTGRARQGSTRAPQWRHGATCFGPMPKDYREKVNRKKRAIAYRSLLTSKREAGEIIVVDSLNFGPEAKTKDVRALLRALGAKPKSLIITAVANPDLVRAARNLGNDEKTPTTVSVVDAVNIFDLLTCDTLIIEKAAVAVIEERLS